MFYFFGIKASFIYIVQFENWHSINKYNHKKKTGINQRREGVPCPRAPRQRAVNMKRISVVRGHSPSLPMGDDHTFARVEWFFYSSLYSRTDLRTRAVIAGPQPSFITPYEPAAEYVPWLQVVDSSPLL